MSWINDSKTSLQDLKDAIDQFTTDRHWRQFHSLKNLSMAIVSEAAELMAHFRWAEDGSDVASDKASAAQVRQEVADVLLLLAEFAIVAKIDLAQAVAEKMEINAQRYPVEKSRGTARKYDRL